MKYLEYIFSQFDKEKNGVVDMTSFKHLLNILSLPINNIEDKNYSHIDLENYIGVNHDDKLSIKKKDLGIILKKVKKRTIIKQ